MKIPDVNKVKLVEIRWWPFTVTIAGLDVTDWLAFIRDLKRKDPRD